jgi:hypothetical protein
VLESAGSEDTLEGKMHGRALLDDPMALSLEYVRELLVSDLDELQPMHN